MAQAHDADALATLLEGLVDYAGLFPPASLSMAKAAQLYDEYYRGPRAWALGRFVVPAARLDEIDRYATSLAPGEPWRLSVLVGAADLEAVARFNLRHGAHVVVDTLETKASTVAEVSAFAAADSRLPPDGHPVPAFVEVPIADDADALVPAIKSRGLRAKVRTGGVTADAFPTAAQLARFLHACSTHDVMFKATAGLHHPLRGEYPLTYESGVRGTMFGFLNVFLAALFLRSGLSERDAVALLEERDARALVFGADTVNWRGHVLAVNAIRAMRERFATSFGSCSFSEPLAELTSMGLL